MEPEVPLTKARLWFLSAAEQIQPTLPYSFTLRSVLHLSCYRTNIVLLYEVRHLCHAYFSPSLRQRLRLDVRIVSLWYNMPLCSQNRRSGVITGNILNSIIPPPIYNNTGLLYLSAASSKDVIQKYLPSSELHSRNPALKSV